MFYKRFVPILKKPLKVEAVIFGFTGTVVDKYSLATSLAIKEVFDRRNIHLSLEKIREPMGLRKDFHIAQLLNNSEIQLKWMRQYGKPSNIIDVEKMYAEYVPIQLEFLKSCGVLLPNVRKILHNLQKEGIKIGHTSSFNNFLVRVLLSNVKYGGYIPNSVVSSSDIRNTRPYPSMIYKNMDNLSIQNVNSVVKVDSTIPGIEEGLNSGCWTVGVYKYSSYINYNSLENDAFLLSSETAEEMKLKELSAFEKLKNSGAHYVIDTIEALPCVINDINGQLADYDKPL